MGTTTSTRPTDADATRVVAWCPQPGPQSAAVECPAQDLFYGGARGGGKTDLELGEFAIHGTEYGRHARGVLFRRNLDELEEVESRAAEIYPLLGGTFEVQKRRWTLARGATLRFRSLETIEDARKHQGRAYTRVYFDELGNFEDPKPFDFMWGSVRSRYGVPCRRISSGNPGGPGHVWVKKRYVDPGPWRIIRVVPIEERPDLFHTQCFIPASLDDNALLHLNDPGYESRLAAVGGPKLFRAWRMGDWDAMEGQYFDCFDPETGVSDPDAMGLQPWHRRWIAMDWGFEHPASFGFFASDATHYFLTHSVSVRHHDVAALARMVRTQAAIAGQKGSSFRRFYLSPDAFATEGDGNTIAQRLTKELRPYGFPAPTPAVTDRVNGWRAMYDLILNGRFVIGSGCKDLLEIIPAAVHDPDHPEDLLKFDGDDPLDMARYGLMTALLEAHKPAEERMKEAVSDKVIDEGTGTVSFVLPANPNVLAMRVRMQGNIQSSNAPFRPKPRRF